MIKKIIFVVELYLDCIYQSCYYNDEKCFSFLVISRFCVKCMEKISCITDIRGELEKGRFFKNAKWLTFHTHAVSYKNPVHTLKCTSE